VRNGWGAHTKEANLTLINLSLPKYRRTAVGEAENVVKQQQKAAQADIYALFQAPTYCAPTLPHSAPLSSLAALPCSPSATHFGDP